ncbi:hypothetical protein evm_012284 [Chilo suppressalis]|nr:hypothetical protein evm_012284 [Chilo suppressalis]
MTTDNIPAKTDIKNADNSKELVVHNVVHCQQRFNWDCGVTCVMMLLSEQQRNYFLQNFTAICREEGFNQSTWTIDLCYLLKRFGIKHTMYTTMPGVNEDYKKLAYYSRILDLDRSRVVRKFASAARYGVEVRKGLVSGAELARHVRRRGPALLLVDAARLHCRWCRPQTLSLQLKHWLGMRDGYRGHYVLVVGASGDILIYRDPALPARLCAARADRMGTHPATDRDAVLLHPPYAALTTDTTMTSIFWNKHPGMQYT